MNYCLLDLDDIDPKSIISQEITELDENNIKKIITIYLRHDNKKVKRISTVKVKEIKMKKSVYERRQKLKKFGLALNKSDNDAITTYGQEVRIEPPNSHIKKEVKPVIKKENQILFKDRKKFKEKKNFIKDKKEKYVPLSKRNNDKYSVCVTNIPDYFNDRDFLELGRQFGKVSNSKLLKSYENPRLNRGIGFLHYTNVQIFFF